jgi:hypothetical protein
MEYISLPQIVVLVVVITLLVVLKIAHLKGYIVKKEKQEVTKYQRLMLATSVSFIPIAFGLTQGYLITVLVGVVCFFYMYFRTRVT